MSKLCFLSLEELLIIKNTRTFLKRNDIIWNKSIHTASFRTEHITFRVGFSRCMGRIPTCRIMVTKILNCRVKHALKYLAVVTLLLVSIYYLRSFRDTNLEHVWHRKISESHDVIDDVTNLKNVHRPNDLVSSDSGGYKNSQNLVEKLRPKLVTRDPSDKDAHPGEPIWNDLVSIFF